MALDNVRILHSLRELRGWSRKQIYEAQKAVKRAESLSATAVTLNGTVIEIHGQSIPAEDISAVWLEIGPIYFVDKDTDLYKVIDLICLKKIDPTDSRVYRYSMNCGLLEEALKTIREAT